MPDPTDLLKAWQDAVREVGGIAASLVSGPAGKAGELLEPMQRQAEQVQRVLERQLEFERELVTRAIAPARATLEMAEQATIAYRAQATAFRAAAGSPVPSHGLRRRRRADRRPRGSPWPVPEPRRARLYGRARRRSLPAGAPRRKDGGRGRNSGRRGHACAPGRVDSAATRSPGRWRRSPRCTRSARTGVAVPAA